MAVLHWGEPKSPLAIAAALMGAELREMGEWPEEEREDWLEVAGATQPFSRALLLQAGMLVHGPLTGLFDSRAPIVEETESLALVVCGGALSAALSVEARRYFPGAPGVLICAGDPTAWSDAAWAVWSQTEAACAEAMAAEVRVPEDVCIVTVAGAESAGAFQRSWLTWRFRPRVPVRVLLAGFPKAELWLPSGQPAPEIVELSREEAGDPRRLLEEIVRACPARRAIFLPPNASAVPGAELWLAPHWHGMALAPHATTLAREELALSGNYFVPEPFYGIASVDFLRRVGAAIGAGFSQIPSLSALLHLAAGAFDGDLPWADASRWGWKFPQTYRYVPCRWREWKGVKEGKEDALSPAPIPGGQ